MTNDDGMQCPIYEHRSANYPRCLANFPGFTSDTNSGAAVIETPTNTKVDAEGSNYFLRMQNDGNYDYTGLTLE